MFDLLREYVMQFYAMSDAAFEQLCSLLQFVELKKRELLIEAGTVDSNLYIPFSGFFRAYYYDRAQNENTEIFVTPGNPMASLASYFRDEPALLQVEAVTDASAYRISRADMEQLCRQSIEVANWFRMVCIDELYCLERKCIIFGEKDAGYRYQNIIKNRPDIMKYMPLKYIASYLGITQQSLSRLRRQK